MTATPPTPAPSPADTPPDWDLPDLVPARILNEFTYCPRLAFLEWVHGEFAHSADTLDGAYKHRRVERDQHATLEAGEPPAEDLHLQSVHLSAPKLGLVAVIDVLESAESSDGALTPVDYKRGRVPDIPERAWEPERVQLCAQGLVLRENGHRCDAGVLYYVGSRTRVPVGFDDALCQRTRQLLEDLRRMAAAGHIPAPLVDSPKCPRCSLVGICLPDETHLLAADPSTAAPVAIRPLVARRPESRPLYVQEQGARVGLSGDELEVRGRGDKSTVLARARIPELAHLAVYGNVQVSTQALHRLCREQIPIAYFSYGGWLNGLTTGLPSSNIDLRRRQFAQASDYSFCLQLAQAFVRGKIANQRTLLRRNCTQAPPDVLTDLKAAVESTLAAPSIATLLGIEGNAARLYFSHFNGMLKPRANGAGEPTWASFDFERRTRRPPTDPVNALLSFVYSLLVRDLTATCWTVGFDPYLGFFHQPRYGRPALALDLMEEFRPLVGDSVVLTLINNGEVATGDFIRRGAAVALTSDGRKCVLKAYERRLETEVTHPLFGYQVTYRRAMEIQARLLGRALLGDIPGYTTFTTR